MRRPAAFGDSCRDVDGVSQEVGPSAETDAAVDTRADLETLALQETLVVPEYTPLNFDSCTNGEQRLRKFGHDGIADRFDDDSLELPDCARDEIIVTLYQQQSRCVAEAIEVVGRADDVGEKDGALCLMTTNFFVNLRANLEELVDVGFLNLHLPFHTRVSLA